MTEPKRNQNDNASSQGMNIDVGHLSVTGHVLFAGRDGSISINTGGDVAQTNTTTMTVGGVETSREQYDSMVSSIRNVDSTIQNEILEPDSREAADHNLSTVEQQLTSERKPNPQILIQAVRALARLSPTIGGAILSLFAEPLVGQIIGNVGGVLQNFYNAMMEASKKSE